MNQSEQIDQLATALSIAQGEIEGAIEKSDNPYFKSKYADLHTVMQACKKPLRDNGLSVVMTYEVENEKNYLVTRLLHKSGQWIMGRVLLPQGKGDSQSIGGSTTYFRRYSLSSLIGLSTYDDDGEEERKAINKQESRHMAKPVDHKVPEVTVQSPKPEPEKVDASALKTLQKSVCGQGLLVGDDDVSNFLDFLVEKYPSKTKQELITSALSSVEKKEKFTETMQEWMKR